MNLINRPASPPSRKALPHRTSIATVCLSGTLLDKLQAIAAAGYDGVEIFENDLLHFPGTREDIRRACDELGLKIEMYQPFRDLEGAPTDEELRRSLERLERKFQWMDELGTDLVLLCSNCSPSSVGDKEKMVGDLRAAAELAEKYNKRIAYEALAWGQHVHTWEYSWELVKEVDHPCLGICFDTFHIFSRECNISTISSVPKEKIFFIQLADAPILKMDHLSYSRHHRNFPLQGSFPILEFMNKVIGTGYTGPLSLEIFNDEFRAAPAKRIAADGYRSLLFLQAEMYNGCILPPMPDVMGVEFVEFAVDEARIGPLESFFLDMGLRKVGKHRSKSVTVFRNRGVNFIVNAEPESFASAFMVLHDISVCATAVRVSNVQAMIDRAVYLGCPVVSPSRLGEGEERVTAIQAPDDTLIYLVDNDEFWKKDFLFEPESMNAYNVSKASYGGIDHIAQALDRLSMDRFVLFYKSVFGMVPQQVIELQDPYGLTKSRAMVSPNHSLRFPLNISDEKDTSIGRLVREASGSVVHHIALETNDIFQTVAALRKYSAQDRFLRVPQNYYDDLAVRYDLQPELIAKLANYNIMYDRDEKGEFLHLSTEQFRDRFFFEIVQRSTGYTHFASINAPIRMSIHHERRNLAQKVGSALSSQQKTFEAREASKEVVAVFLAGCERIVELIADILGKSISFDTATRAGVIGVPVESATTVLPSVDKVRYVTINLHCTDGPASVDRAVSGLCDFEFFFSATDVSRKDLTRFLSFIMGESHAHETILSKPRSTFIALTFPDIRPALPNLDILTVGADAIELRVDLLREGVGSGAYNPVPSISYVGQQLALLRKCTELPIIFTLRSQAEGGRCPSSDETVTHYLLSKGLQWGCEYIDVEIRLPDTIRRDLAAKKGRSRILASYHDLAGNLKWSSGEVQRLYHSARTYSDITKIVGFATSLSDNYELEYFRSQMNSTFNHPLLAINAGQIGQLSRILNPFFTPTTHPLLPMAAAPGQLSAAEINGALNIMGQCPRRTLYTIGAPRALPPAMFFEKILNELGLPHGYTALDRLADATIAQLTRQPSFGGALISPPLQGAPHFITALTPTATAAGAVDTIFVRQSGTQTTLVGHNSTAAALLTLLTTDFAPGAYESQPVLVVANSLDDAAPALWALRELHVSTIYTIGFRAGAADKRGVQALSSFEAVTQLAAPFCVVSALSPEQAHLVKPLLRLMERRDGGDDEKQTQKGRVFVDLANGPRRGDPLGVASEKGWTCYGVSDLAARVTVEAMEGLVGTRVPGGIVRMASGGGLF